MMSRTSHMMSNQCGIPHLSVAPICQGNDMRMPVHDQSSRRQNCFSVSLFLARRNLYHAAGVNRPSSSPYFLVVQMHLVERFAGIYTISIRLANTGASDASHSEIYLLEDLALLFHLSEYSSLRRRPCKGVSWCPLCTILHQQTQYRTPFQEQFLSVNLLPRHSCCHKQDAQICMILLLAAAWHCQEALPALGTGRSMK